MMDFLRTWFEFDKCPYDRMDPATLSFCEEQVCAWVRTPANSYSCFLICMVGLYMVIRASKPAVYRYLGWVTILLGLFSFVAHATTTFFGQALDIASMYLFSGLLLAYLAQKKWSISQTAVILTCLGSIVVPLTLLLMFKSHLGIIFFALEIGAAAYIAMKLGRSQLASSRKYLYLASGTLALSFVSWSLDTFKIACNPSQHLLHGHVGWHVGVTMAIYFVGEYLIACEAPKES